MTIQSPAPEPFTACHIGRLAETLREKLDYDLDTVAENEGNISFHGGRRRVEGLTDAEVTAFLAGLYAMASGFADWLENGWDDDEKRSAVSRHEATSEQITEDILGAEGACLHRRHPKKHAFAGRMRKMNEAVARIRQFRVDLQTAYVAGLLDRGSKNSLQAAADFGYSWHTGGGWTDTKNMLRKFEWGTAGLDEEQRIALGRIKAEHEALCRAIARVRKSQYEQIRRESDNAFAAAMERRAA